MLIRGHVRSGPLPFVARQPWSARLAGPPAAALLLLIFGVALLAEVRTKSATFDEPGHAAAGYSYWITGDYRLDPENGLLPQRWFGLALLGARPAFPSPDHDAWQHTDPWALADHWLNRMGNDAAAILRRGRAAAAVFTVALGAIVWLWARDLFGPWGGMISLLLYVLNPTVLAHGALMTSDIAGALCFIVFTWCFHRMLERVTTWRVILSGAALGILVISKMSAVLALPLALVLAAARLWDQRPLLFGSTRELRRPWSKAGALLAAAALHAPTVLAIGWAAYGFRFAAHPSGDPAQSRFQFPWELVLDQPHPRSLLHDLALSPAQAQQAAGLWRETGAAAESWSYAAIETLQRIKGQVLSPAQANALETAWRNPPLSFPAGVIAFARRHRLLPEACLYGYAHVWRFSRQRGGFLNGEVSPSGSPWFFPYAFAVKTPLAAFGVFALAAAALAARWRRQRVTAHPLPSTLPPAPAPTLLPLVALLIVYGAAAIASEVNIGVRHLLPLFPPLFILAGGAAYWIDGDTPGRPRPALCLALLFLLAALLVEAAGWFPNHLAYFNGLVRPSRGYRHLIDSSLDWGQDLPALRRQLDQQPAAKPQFLAYFGTASPAGHGIRAQQIYSYPPGDRAAVPPLKIVPGPRDNATLVTVLQRHADYDPRLVYSIEIDGQPATLLVKRAPALQLAAGRYWISASLVQPVHYPQAFGQWSAQHEQVYQQLRETTVPLLSDARAARVTALQKFPPETWERILRDFEEYRFARLTAWLRRREPDEHVNYSILAYDLTAADLHAALHGPPPTSQD